MNTSPAVSESMLGRVHGIASFLWIGFCVAAITLTLFSGGTLDRVASETAFLTSLTATIGLWLIVPRAWLSYRVMASCTAIAFAVVNSLVGYRFYVTREVRANVASIRQAGGYVEFNYQWTDFAMCKTANGWWVPMSLRRRLGDSFFGDVVHARILVDDNRKLDQLDLSAVGHLTDISLTESATDESLRKVGRLGRLRALSVNAADVTERGIDYLQPIRLQQLSVFNLSLTQEMLTALEQKQVPNLEVVANLARSSVRATDAYDRLQQAMVGSIITVVERWYDTPVEYTSAVE